MTAYAFLLSLFLALVPQAATTNVRVRLFSAEQPSQIQFLKDQKPPDQIRAVGAELFLNERKTPSPLRITGPAQVRPQGGELVHTAYPMEISARGGKLYIIATIPREDYVAGVLTGEASVFKSDESLKAMAVTARTYSVRFLGRHKDEGFDFCDSTHCQAYQGSAIPARARKAVDATSAELLWYDGVPIEAYYHQDCGGITESRSPYLPQIHDAFCVAHGRMHWSTEITPAELMSALQMKTVRSIEVAARTPSGRASKIRITGDVTRTLDAEDFRLSVGRILGWNRVRSDLYDVHRSGNGFIFDGYGSGHGIGLCQHGAAVMGEDGRSYRQILAYYFPNAVLGTTAAGISWIKSGGGRADLEATRRQDENLLDLVERQMRTLEAMTGLRFEIRPLLRVYPTVAAFRDAAGEPGWVAASTKNGVIRIQPADTLRARGILEQTLQHEVAHVLVESHAKPGLPAWFREGVVLWLTQPRITGGLSSTINVPEIERALDHPQNEAQLRQAYRSAQEMVEKQVRTQGKDPVLRWIQSGVPGKLSF